MKKLKIHLHFDGVILCGREVQNFETVSEYFEQCCIEDNIDMYYCTHCINSLYVGRPPLSKGGGKTARKCRDGKLRANGKNSECNKYEV